VSDADGRAALIRRELGRRLSRSRVEHARGVAALARELCARFGASEEDGEVAGLAHDLARELDPASLEPIAARDGRPILEDERRMPVILHGRAGAVILRDELGIDDPAILDAVRDHVTGRAGMGVLSCIVYAADYLEPGRGFLEESARKAILSGSLAAMVRAVLRMSVRHLEERGRPIAAVSREVAAWLEREGVGSGDEAARR